MKTPDALAGLEGVTNFRELGGLPTREGRWVRSGFLFRSGHWGHASAADRSELQRLGVKLVFDFRTEADVAHEGADRLPQGVECVRLPTGDPAAADDARGLILSGDRDALRAHFGEGRAEQYMTRAAASLVTDRCDRYAAFLQRLADPGCPPALFHCSAGKDRAGWAASCLLLALGVAEEDVIAHYLVSNETYDAGQQNAGFSHVDPELVALVAPLIKVREEYVRGSIDAIVERWGGLEGYLEEGLGLRVEQRERLKQNWLTDETSARNAPAFGEETRGSA